MYQAKKLLAITLATLMVLCAMPFSVFATAESTEAVDQTAIFTIAEDFEDINVTGTEGASKAVTCTSPYGQALWFGRGSSAANATVTFDKAGTAADAALAFYFDTNGSGYNGAAGMSFIPYTTEGRGTTLGTAYTYYTVIDGVVAEAHPSSNFTIALPADSTGWVIMPLPASGTWNYGGTGAYYGTWQAIDHIYMEFVYYTDASVVLDQFGFVTDVDAFKALAADESAVPGYTGIHDWADANCSAPKTCKDCGITEGEPTGIHSYVGGACSACGATVYTVAEDFADANYTTNGNVELVTCTSPYGQALKFGRGSSAANVTINLDVAGTADQKAIVFYYDNTVYSGQATFSFIPYTSTGRGTTLGTAYTYYTVIDGVVAEAHPSGNFTLKLPQQTAGWVVLPLPASGTWAFNNTGTYYGTTQDIASIYLEFVYYNNASIVVDQFGFTEDVDLFKTMAAAGLNNLSGYTDVHAWTAANCQKPKTCSVCGLTEGEPTGEHNFVGGTCSVCQTTVYTVAEDFNDISVTGTEGSWSAVTSPYGNALKFGRETSKTEIKIALDKLGTADDKAVVFYYDNTVSGNDGAAYFNFIPRYNGGCGLTLGTAYTYYAVIDGEIQTLNPSSNFSLKLPAKTAGWVILPLPASGTWSYGGGSGYTGKVENIASVDLAFPEYHNASVLLDQFGFTADVDTFKAEAAKGLDHLNGYGTTEQTNALAYLGTSVNEAENALRFGFTLNASGITVDGYARNIANATVNVNGSDYKLVDFGAIVSNNANATLTLDGVDGKRTKNIVGEKLFDLDGDTAYFACGIKNIPAANKDSMIYARAYYIYNNGSENIVVYGDEYEQSINGCLAL